MKAVIQRVTSSSVSVDGRVVSSIGRGFNILLGVETGDTQEDGDWLAKKISSLRVFNDSEGVMNLNIKQVSGEILAISQFTLLASTKKGNRPSYIRSEKGEVAERIYEAFVSLLSEYADVEVKKGIFGADMRVEIINDGPVTIIIDTRNKE